MCGDNLELNLDTLTHLRGGEGGAENANALKVKNLIMEQVAAIFYIKERQISKSQYHDIFLDIGLIFFQ